MKLRAINLKILLIFAFFLYPIVIGNLALVCYAFVYGVPLLYIIINYKSTVYYLRHLPSSIFYIITTILFFLVASFALPVLYGTYDLSYANVIIAIFRRLIIYIFLFLIVFRKYRDSLTIETFMFYHIVVTALYVIGSIIFLLLPGLRETWTAFLQLNEQQSALTEGINYITRFGWSGYSGFRNTISCSLSIIFVTYLYASKDCKAAMSLQCFLLLFLFCFLGNMFYGRSGLVVSFLCVLSGLIMYHKISFKFFAGCFLAIASLVICVFYLREYSTVLENWFFWLIIPFENFISTGSFNNASLNHLIEDMYFMPDIDTLLFGDARYMEEGTGLYYMHTDAGPMRQILFWGIFFTAFIYLLCIVLLFLLKFDKGFKTMFLLFIILFEFKGECYYHLLPLFITFLAINKLNKYNCLREGFHKTAIVKD